MKNGSAVPLKFQIFAGATELKEISRIASFTQSRVSCTAATEDAVEEIASTGGTSLRYDATGGQFIQNWQTPKQPGTCWIARVTTQDGSTLSANFKLK